MAKPILIVRKQLFATGPKWFLVPFEHLSDKSKGYANALKVTKGLSFATKRYIKDDRLFTNDGYDSWVDAEGAAYRFGCQVKSYQWLAAQAKEKVDSVEQRLARKE